MPAKIEIKGQAELERAFLDLRRDVFLELKTTLIEAGKSVSDESQRRMPEYASNIGDRWSQFRIGATIKGVYVAPKARPRGGSKRPNLATLLLKDMETALESKRTEVETQVNLMVEAAAAKNGFY